MQLLQNRDFLDVASEALDLDLLHFLQKVGSQVLHITLELLLFQLVAGLQVGQHGTVFRGPKVAQTTLEQLAPEMHLNETSCGRWRESGVNAEQVMIWDLHANYRKGV